MKERFIMQKDGIEDVMIDNESYIVYRCCDMALKGLCNLLNDYEQKIKDLEQEQIEEMKEYQKAMLLADKTIKEERKRVIDEIIAQLSRIEDTLINCGNGKEDALAYFLEILKTVKGVEDGKIDNVN